ncbi:MAG: NUDIX domain-containing protein [Bacteroidetes bacterium]|jgi:dATP pyrophosphohydrolase|nr:NUDIX domain-containing protein [Bacteroidota bacterium]
MPLIASSFVEVAVFRQRGARLEILLVQRAAQERLYPGLWQFVTGKIRDGESAVEAARREVREETGLRVRALWVVPGINGFYGALTDTVHLTPQFVAEAESSSEVVLSTEHQDARWLLPDDARARVLWPANRRLIDYLEQELLTHPELAERTRLAAS